MATKHQDYGSNKQLRFARVSYGLTQAQLAEEVGVQTSYVSLFERGMELPKGAERAISWWLEGQA